MQSKRYVSIAEYQRTKGLSYPTIKHGLETGQIRGVRTEAGHWKVDIADDGNHDANAIIKRLDAQQRLLTALCGHLGVKAQSGR